MRIHMCWVCVEIRSELVAVKTYIEEVREAMPAIAKRLEHEMITENNVAQSGNVEHEVASQIYDQIVDVDLPMRSGHAAVMLAYSAVEVSFMKLTQAIVNRDSLPADLGAFKGDLSERVRTFLRVYGLAEPTEHEYRLLGEFTKMRNVVSHAAGDLSRESKKVRTYVANTPGLCSEMETLMVDADYVLRHLQAFQAMFTRLLNALGYSWNPTVREDPTP